MFDGLDHVTTAAVILVGPGELNVRLKRAVAEVAAAMLSEKEWPPPKTFDKAKAIQVSGAGIDSWPEQRQHDFAKTILDLYEDIQIARRKAAIRERRANGRNEP